MCAEIGRLRDAEGDRAFDRAGRQPELGRPCIFDLRNRVAHHAYRSQMKYLPSQLAYLTTNSEARTNVRALAKYLAFLAGLVTVYAVMFHVIKLNVRT
jgi:hypothetical protein